MTPTRPGLWSRMAPALTLALLAPLVAEVLPGATRFSSIFVFPIEVAVWGGGAVLIRALARRLGLGWIGLLFMALALAVAEEILIQQTSIAPLVIKLKGVVYARAYGVNYLYLLWALIYESVLVVLIPVQLTELIFPSRRETAWLSRSGAIVTLLVFAAGARLAWFSWTQIARTKIFHLPPYDPPVAYLAAGAAAIVVLVLAGVIFGRRREASGVASPPATAVIGALAAIWAALLFALVVLAFGAAPEVPPAAAVGGGVLLGLAPLLVLPRLVRSTSWRDGHRWALVFGTMLGAMGAGFVGFIGAEAADFWFKAGADTVAIALMIVLGLRLREAGSDTKSSG